MIKHKPEQARPTLVTMLLDMFRMSASEAIPIHLIIAHCDCYWPWLASSSIQSYRYVCRLFRLNPDLNTEDSAAFWN